MDGEPPPEVSIRVASPDDRVAVARVLDGALLEVEGLGERLAEGCVLVATTARTADGTADDGGADDSTAADGNADGSTVVGGTVVGAIVVASEGPTERSPPTGWPAAAHLRALAVRRKRRRNGIGAALVRAALERWSPIVADFESGIRPFYDALGAECQQDPDGRHWALLRKSKSDWSRAQEQAVVRKADAVLLTPRDDGVGVRQFSAEYLASTRRGMWADSRDALEALELTDRDQVLDVGCGTGELTRVLAEETEGTVVGVDADRSLLTADRSALAAGRSGSSDSGDANSAPPAWDSIAGDALSLPLADDAVDLVVCQALLINLPDPAAAVEEFSRVAAGAVAAIEPDNADVTVESTVDGEATLAAEARASYRRGVSTDVSLGGAGTREAFEAAGLTDVRTTRYDHVRTIEPPYGEGDLEAVRRAASGEGIADDRETLLAGGLDAGAYDDLRERWRAVGREAIEQVGDGEYRRREVVPFYVTVGSCSE